MQMWNNVPGDCSVELEEDLQLDSLLLKEGDEVTIHFLASGYYQQMSRYGGPDHLGWPEEGDDERIVCRVTVNEQVYTDAKVLEAAQEHFYSEIYDAELLATERLERDE